MTSDIWTGGCQCGRVRYAFAVKPDGPCICHCRMCQKQSGNFFGAFAGSDPANFSVTRGKITAFQSSSDVERGFCRDCGTPLTFRYKNGSRIAVTIGSLDRHTQMPPAVQYGIEGREPWFSDLHLLPATVTGEGDKTGRYERIREQNFQHPDHDTANWDAAGG
jgi:hypothetical protein